MPPPLDPHKVKYLKSDDQTRSDLESFVRGVQRFLLFFFFRFFYLLGWRVDRNATKSGTLSARHRNAIPMAFCWRADNGPPLNAGLVALRFLGDPDQYC